MKTILLAALSIMISLAPVQKAHAIAGTVMAVGGVAGAGAVALTGLASPIIGTVIATSADSYDEWAGLGGFMVGTVIGILLLDEQQGSVTFNTINEATFKNLKITKSEAAIYNSEVEEANILFEEVKSELSAYSTVEESRALWSDMKDFVSPETFKVMKRLTEKN